MLIQALFKLFVICYSLIETEAIFVQRDLLPKQNVSIATTEPSFGTVRQSRTVEHWLSLEYGTTAPDGFSRQMILINGSFPGPQINVRQGDLLILHVKNNLFYEGASLHVHGLHNRGSPQYDGVAYGTQWPILPGKEFTYRYNITNSPGTYWYHAHYQLQSQGVFGAFIIQEPQFRFASSPAVNYTNINQNFQNSSYANSSLTAGGIYEYDEERVILLSDWYHASDVTQLVGLMSTSFKWIGDPQSLLINGRGRFNCSLDFDVDPQTCNSTALEYERIQVEPGKTYRFRLIGATSLSYLQFSIEGHEMTIIEADGLTLLPATVNSLEINSGERYSVLVKANQNPRRSYNMTSGIRYRKSGPTGYAILEYVNRSDNTTSGNVGLTIPEVPIYMDLTPQSRPEWILPQLKPHPNETNYEPMPQTSNRLIILEGKQMKFAHHMADDNNATMMKWAVNDHFFETNTNVPLLMAAYQGEDAFYSMISEESRPLVFSVNEGDVVDIVLQNTVALNGICEQHPWHLHGYHFWVLGSGPGRFSNLNSTDSLLNFDDPIMKDTVTLYPHQHAFFETVDPANAGQPCGWKLIRVEIDNPGVWNMHCHITAHMHMGMQVFFADDIGKVRNLLDLSMAEDGLGMGDDVTLSFLKGAQGFFPQLFISDSHPQIQPNTFLTLFLSTVLALVFIV